MHSPMSWVRSSLRNSPRGLPMSWVMRSPPAPHELPRDWEGLGMSWVRGSP